MIACDVKGAYEDVVKWQRNIFTLPKGQVGKMFIQEMTNLINTWCNKTEWREIAITSVMILPSLMLQKALPKSKTSENKKILQRRLTMWKGRKIDELVRECKAIQSRIGHTKRENTLSEVAKKFANLVISGNINGALKLLENEGRGGVLTLNDKVLEALKEKHPDAEDINDIMVLHGPKNYVDQVIFEEINAELIQKMTMKTRFFGSIKTRLG